MTNPIDPVTGEYRQDIAEKSNMAEPVKSGVEINVEESNKAAAKVDKPNVPNSFDKTNQGKSDHAKKFGAQEDAEGGENTTPVQEQENPVTEQRKTLRRNQK